MGGLHHRFNVIDRNRVHQLFFTDSDICESLPETAAPQRRREDTLSDHAAGSLLCEGVEHVVVLGFSNTRPCWNFTSSLNGIWKLAPGPVEHCGTGGPALKQMTDAFAKS